MGKAPAFQFYVKDWLSDPQLRMASLISRGIWIDLLCLMWESSERGKLEGTIEQFTRMTSASNGDFQHFLDEAQVLKFADVSVTEMADVTKRNIKVTVINRRMFREDKDRKNTRLRVRKFRSNAKCNSDVTVPSSSSTASPILKEIKKKDSLSLLSGKPDPVPYQEIIAYLNFVCSKNFSSKTDLYKKHIKARWNSGKRLPDFKRVVDIKFAKWGTDPKMIDFLRPETLFGTKMDSYLQEEIDFKLSGGDMWLAASQEKDRLEEEYGKKGQAPLQIGHGKNGIDPPNGNEAD